MTDPAPTAWAQRADDLPPLPDGGFDLAVKASTAVRGFAWHAGCPLFADQVASSDASVVAALRRHGARVVGTTNLHEMAMGITSANAWLGPVANPADPTRSAGGSSGGSAAVVARGEVPLALGGDTGGSISIPASVCGVVGFRPTVGRYPRDGHLGMSWTRDTPGLFARSVAEIATADGWLAGTPTGHTDTTGTTGTADTAGRAGRASAAATAGRASAAATAGTPEQSSLVGLGAPGSMVVPSARRGQGSSAARRLAVPVDYLADLHRHTRATWGRARAALEVEWDLVEVSFDSLRPLLAGPSWTLIGWECRVLFAQFAAQALGVSPDEGWRRLLDGIVTPDVIESLHRADAYPVTADVYEQAVARTLAAREEYERVLAAAGCEVAVFPTTVRPATRLGDDGLVTWFGERMHVFALMTRNVAAGTMLRAPMLTLPVPVDPGELPVGITLQGRPFGDATVLATGARLEGALAAA